VRLLAIDVARAPNRLDMKRVGGGLAGADHRRLRRLGAAHRDEARSHQGRDERSRLAFRVAKFVKSNAIVFLPHGRTLGVGAGQMSRVDSTRIAAIKAKNAGLSLRGSVVASDAFFPFATASTSSRRRARAR